MLSVLLAVGFMAAQDTDIILIERPVPLTDGGSRRALCERVEVEIEYANSWAKGVQRLEGYVSFSGKKKDISAILSDIRRTSAKINDVTIWCEDLNVAAVAIDVAATDGGDQRWLLTVNEKLNIAVEGPSRICKTGADCD
ncbi:MAG: hypothetical protein ACOZAA_14965 [Pseudomonadota bacterium]